MADVTACPLETIRTFQIQTGSHLKITKCHINPFNLIFEAVLSDAPFFFKFYYSRRINLKGAAKQNLQGQNQFHFLAATASTWVAELPTKKKKKPINILQCLTEFPKIQQI